MFSRMKKNLIKPTKTVQLYSKNNVTITTDPCASLYWVLIKWNLTVWRKNQQKKNNSNEHIWMVLGSAYWWAGVGAHQTKKLGTTKLDNTVTVSVLLTCRLFCMSSIHEESFLSEEPDMPFRQWGSKVMHMTGSGWALARLSVDLWVTSHSNREPSSYPANRRGPGPESGWGREGGW